MPWTIRDLYEIDSLYPNPDHNMKNSTDVKSKLEGY